MTAISPNVFARNGAVFANSRDVAAYFGKEHRHVLRDIDQLIEKQQSPKLDVGVTIPDGWFVEYVEPRPENNPGRPFRHFDMTRDGFTLLAMGFTGDRALRFKLAYIDAFNRMEAELRHHPSLEAASPTDSLPAEDVRYWLKMVGEARMLFGKSAARDLWRRSPLPAVHTDDPAPGLDADTAADLDGAGCLDHLLGWRPGRGGTVRDLLNGDRAANHGALCAAGVHPGPKGWHGWFAVAVRHSALSVRFTGTAWNQAWGEALLSLPGARRCPQSLRFGDTVSRAVLLPRGLLVSPN